jgi:hypothetical protein
MDRNQLDIGQPDRKRRNNDAEEPAKPTPPERVDRALARKLAASGASAASAAAYDIGHNNFESFYDVDRALARRLEASGASARRLEASGASAAPARRLEASTLTPTQTPAQIALAKIKEKRAEQRAGPSYRVATASALPARRPEASGASAAARRPEASGASALPARRPEASGASAAANDDVKLSEIELKREILKFISVNLEKHPIDTIRDSIILILSQLNTNLSKTYRNNDKTLVLILLNTSQIDIINYLDTKMKDLNDSYQTIFKRCINIFNSIYEFISLKDNKHIMLPLSAKMQKENSTLIENIKYFFTDSFIDRINRLNCEPGLIPILNNI